MKMLIVSGIDSTTARAPLVSSSMTQLWPAARIRSTSERSVP